MMMHLSRVFLTFLILEVYWASRICGFIVSSFSSIISSTKCMSHPLSSPLGTLIVCISDHLKSSHRSPILCSFLLFTHSFPWFLFYCYVFKLHNLFFFFFSSFIIFSTVSFDLLLILPGKFLNQTCDFNHSKLIWGCFYIFHVFACSILLTCSMDGIQL